MTNEAPLPTDDPLRIDAPLPADDPLPAGDPLPIGDLLRVAAADAVPVVGGIADASLGAPTPCAEYDVRALINHFFSVVVNFQVLAAKGTPDFSETPDRVADAGWRELFGAEAGKLVEAWSAPGAEEGTSGAMGLPARTVGCMVLLDLTVHAWDLARATGRSFEPDPVVVAGLADEVERMAPMARKMGVFGDAVGLPGDATAFERLLATTGRDPHAR
ncbi:TIGR03086 family protein [Streptomyces sp. SID5770]|uniref:TIGR03086 family metal-binding protein n=1 Tax=Streptomyces sp. SID5770 TaxID=2690308 RepID=UPI001369A757|nr:TIGR03086 family metal-binding protein [Streptomyces sp. SID5770]MZE57041.1 TIGR03086 family protein [Streptomyces sp. SID5770]